MATSISVLVFLQYYQELMSVYEQVFYFYFFVYNGEKGLSRAHATHDQQVAFFRCHLPAQRDSASRIPTI